MFTQPRDFISVEAYLAHERESDGKSEYVAGEKVRLGDETG